MFICIVMKINVKTMEIRKIIIIGFQKYVLRKQNCVFNVYYDNICPVFTLDNF